MIVSKVNGKEVSYSSLSYASAAEEENTKTLSETEKNTLNPQNSNVQTLENFGAQKIKEQHTSPIEIRKEDTAKKVYDNIKSDDDKNKKVYDNVGGENPEDEGFNDYKLSYDGKASSIMNSFESLAAALGASDSKITKGQLLAYLQTLSVESANSDDTDKTKEIAFLKRLIARFDTLSGGENYITSLRGVNEPQDYKTVTQDQLQSPIEILI